MEHKRLKGWLIVCTSRRADYRNLISDIQKPDMPVPLELVVLAGGCLKINLVIGMWRFAFGGSYG